MISKGRLHMLCAAGVLGLAASARDPGALVRTETGNDHEQLLEDDMQEKEAVAADPDTSAVAERDEEKAKDELLTLRRAQERRKVRAQRRLQAAEASDRGYALSAGKGKDR
jgi:hypothetical protein